MHLRLLVFISIFVILVKFSKSDTAPGFFVKITKNVPRLGRRSDANFDKFYRKASKNVPRVGKRNEIIEAFNTNEQSQIGNSIDLEQLLSGEYSVIEPLNKNKLYKLLKTAHETDKLKFVSWKDFDLALKYDDDLYQKIISLAKDAKELEKFDSIQRTIAEYENSPLYSENDIETNNSKFYYQTENYKK